MGKTTRKSDPGVAERMPETQARAVQTTKTRSPRRQRTLFAVIMPLLYFLGLITGTLLSSPEVWKGLGERLALSNEPTYEPVEIPDFLLSDSFELTLSKQDLSTPEEMADWQHQIRARARTLLGLEDKNEAIPSWRTDSTTPRDGYSEARLLVDAPDGDTIVAYKLSPEDWPEPSAAVLVVPGSGEGVAGVLGHIEDYQQRIGVALVREGYLVYAIENRGWGERAIDVGSGNDPSSTVYAVYSIQLGYPLASRYVADVGTVLRLMSSDPQVDPDRIAVVGCSLGGSIALWAGALLPQVSAVVSASGLAGDAHDPETWGYLGPDQMIVPGMFAYFDYEDIAATIAPRALLLTYGLGEVDRRYGIEARTQEAYKHLQPVWTMLNAGERLDFVAHSGGHTYDIPATIRFLDEALMHK